MATVYNDHVGPFSRRRERSQHIKPISLCKPADSLPEHVGEEWKAPLSRNCRQSASQDTHLIGKYSIPSSMQGGMLVEIFMCKLFQQHSLTQAFHFDLATPGRFLPLKYLASIQIQPKHGNSLPQPCT